MAEKLEAIAQRLKDEPVYSGDPAMKSAMLNEHIAYSLWRIANALEAGHRTLDKIGMNDLNAAGPPGALEFIGMELKRVADAIEAKE